ncbi:MlaD family protein [Terrihabitans sp. B22-R8]|uniref:MlaD family protein n=1 Tax=Terrihabitans sp. B22-R8 TaxID=3425128 RepID=UPI00403C137E
METRANHFVIGLFTLAVVVGAFSFVWWFTGKADQGNRAQYRVVFDGSVSGLSRGSAVLFNGVNVGEVTAIDIVPDQPGRISTTIAVNSTVPVRSDTKAQLEYQGVTGVASVMLQGGQPDAPPLQAAEGGVPVIVAQKSTYQDLMEGARGLLNQLGEFIDDNRGPLTDSVANVQKFTDALAANSDGIKNLLGATSDMASAVSEVAGPLRDLTGDARRIVQAIDPQKIASIVESTEKFTATMTEAGPKLNVVLGNAETVTTNLVRSSANLNETLTRVHSVVAAVDPDRVRQVLDNTAAFSETLKRNAPSVDEIVADARELSDRLNKASTRIDGILVRADSLLGEGQNSGVFDEVREAAKSIRVLSDNLDKRTASLSGDISNFTGQGLRDLSGLISSGRQTLQGVDRVVRDLERNPQRFIFGGGGVPEYAPRR